MLPRPMNPSFTSSAVRRFIGSPWSPQIVDTCANRCSHENRKIKNTRPPLDTHDLSPAFLGRAALMGARRLPVPCSTDLVSFLFSFLIASVGSCLEYLS